MEDTFHLGVKALIRNSKGEILLLKINKDKLKNFVGDYDLPGGRVHKNNTIEETLKRKVEEEIGIKEITNIKPFLTVLTKIRISQDSDSVGLILDVYTCDIPVDSEIKSPEEYKPIWAIPDEASNLLTINFPTELTQKIREII